jgi:tetratricopeptide (TPR) repeat protein
VVNLHEQDPQAVPEDVLATAYQLLGEGYTKKHEKQKAKAAYEKVIALAPDTPAAEAAARSIEKLTPKPPSEGAGMQAGEEVAQVPVEELEARVKADPENAQKLAELGKAYLDAGEITKAENTLRKATELDPENANAHKWLVMAMGEAFGGEIYDERIHEDTDWAARMAFEMVELLDKTVALAPQDMETRLMRGIADIQMPFFTGKLEQGMEDLEMVLESDAPEDMKAQATYWLGFAHRKKGTTYWIKAITDYPEDEAAEMAMQSMRPPIAKFDPAEYPAPLVVVDFVLGFRDELPPQTAVWVETPEGDFLRTIYVSGFSGHAREVQVVLPVWASTSEFADADAITGASIDTGEHIHIWDLKDASGEPVQPGDYVIKVETHYWPSMKYEMVSGEISIGEEENRSVVEGTFIPYLEIRYIP